MADPHGSFLGALPRAVGRIVPVVPRQIAALPPKVTRSQGLHCHLGNAARNARGAGLAAGLQTTASPQSAPNSLCAIAASPHKRSRLSNGSCRQPQRPMIDWGQTEASAVSISAPAKKAELPGSDVRKEETCPPLPISTHASVSFREVRPAAMCRWSMPMGFVGAIE